MHSSLLLPSTLLAILSHRSLVPFGNCVNASSKDFCCSWDHGWSSAVLFSSAGSLSAARVFFFSSPLRAHTLQPLEQNKQHNHLHPPPHSHHLSRSTLHHLQYWQRLLLAHHH